MIEFEFETITEYRLSPLGIGSGFCWVRTTIRAMNGTRHLLFWILSRNASREVPRPRRR